MYVRLPGYYPQARLRVHTHMTRDWRLAGVTCLLVTAFIFYTSPSGQFSLVHLTHAEAKQDD